MECFGYGIRIASSHDVASKPKFVAQYVLIVLAPVLMTGIIYVVFGRIVYHVVPAEARTAKLLWAPRKLSPATEVSRRFGKEKPTDCQPAQPVGSPPYSSAATSSPCSSSSSAPS